MPHVAFVDSLPGAAWPMDEVPQLTLAMSDPDAPSRDDPEWSEICHWIATDIPLSSSSDAGFDMSKDLKEIMPYKPPGPPKKTGKHRYVFVALAPVNGTTEKLNLSKPGDRQHWGYEKERQGLRMWAQEMGLGVVGECFSLIHWRILRDTAGVLTDAGRCKFHLRAERQAMIAARVSFGGDVCCRHVALPCNWLVTESKKARSPNVRLSLPILSFLEFRDCRAAHFYPCQ